jgi:hypothetical protein
VIPRPHGSRLAGHPLARPNGVIPASDVGVPFGGREEISGLPRLFYKAQSGKPRLGTL